MHNKLLLAGLALMAGLGACAFTPIDIAGNASPLELRSIQTRGYDSLDKPLAMRAVVATLQDLGFTIDQADIDLGIITGTRMQKEDMRMTVTVVGTIDNHVSVRANARAGENGIKAAEPYQDFFVALDKAMFLARNNVN